MSRVTAAGGALYLDSSQVIPVNWLQATERGQAHMTYTPMANDRRGFDPTGSEWSYVSDEFGDSAKWRGMVPLALRPFTWPYQLHTDRYGKDPYGSVRLAPDWCYYAWRNEYVLAQWGPEAEHVIHARTTLERRYAPAGEVSDWPSNPFAGEGSDRWQAYEWIARITINLLTGTCKLEVAPHGAQVARAPSVPADVRAEGEHKAAKLLAFFRAECARWQAGDSPRPAQAYALYSALKGERG